MDAMGSLQQGEHAQARLRGELKVYLALPLEETENVLHRWGGSDCYSISPVFFYVHFRLAQYHTTHTSPYGES
jgi:hypothetical protein